MPVAKYTPQHTWARPGGVEQEAARWAHNPEVDGANPSPATVPSSAGMPMSQETTTSLFTNQCRCKGHRRVRAPRFQCCVRDAVIVLALSSDYPLTLLRTFACEHRRQRKSTKTHNMPLLLIIELLLHVLLLVLGIGTIKGSHFATIAFFVLLALMIMVDAIILITAIRNGNDVRRWDL